MMLAPLNGRTARAEEPAKIAFVDTGNTGRSVTAEALANAMIAERKLPILVISRAVDLDPFEVTPEENAAALLKQHGLDVSGHKAAQLTANDVKHATLIFTMTAKHKATVIAAYPDAAAKTFTISDYATGENHDVTDAWQQPMSVYEQVFDQINGYLPKVLEKAAQSAKK